MCLSVAEMCRICFSVAVRMYGSECSHGFGMHCYSNNDVTVEEDNLIEQQKSK